MSTAPPRAAAPIIVRLGGRDLQLIGAGAPAIHDSFLMEQVYAAGLGAAEVPSGLSASEIVDLLLDRVLASGCAWTLLGAMVMPAELDLQDWTPHLAREMELHLERVHGDGDKLQLRGTLAQCCALLVAQRIATVWTKGRAPISRRTKP